MACAWDGSTYIINQEKESVRFQFDQPVSAFCAGHFTLRNDEPPCPTLVYATFNNKIYIYYNITLPRMALHTITDVLDSHPLKDWIEQNVTGLDVPISELVAKMLYEL